MFPDQQITEILVQTNTVGEKELEHYREEAQKRNQSLEDYLIIQKVLTAEQLYQNAASFYAIPFVNLKNETIRKDVLFLIPEPLAATHNIVAFDKNDTELKVAVLDPNNIETLGFLRKKTGLDIKAHLTNPGSLQEVLKLYHKGLKAEFKDIQSEEKTGKNGDKLKELAEDLPVIRIVDTLLEYAILENASDIHIEPTEKEVLVRYRIDGVLKKVMTLPHSAHPGIVARIKILADLKLDEHRLPQDGRFKISAREYNVSFRVSIIPTYDGEKVVLRLLNEKTSLLSLEDLGFHSKAFGIVKKNIDKPHGMILVTGPTGSGKTTTLYAILNVLNKPEVNITTIEDPIEYRLNGINQSQVNPKIGYTFAAGLRAYLRQDPDIIMVGEIRDKETAEIGINAALTGHLVLSTLHTNDAPTTLPRLTEMGVPAFLIASTTNVIIAQRLARKICSDCIESYTLSSQDIKNLEEQVNLKLVLERMQAEGVITEKQSRESLLFYRGKGCKKCGDEGYRGRVGLYEVLEVTPEVGQLILQGATAEAIRAKAREQGMLTLLEDGFIKAKTGITTLEEVLRVTKE